MELVDINIHSAGYDEQSPIIHQIEFSIQKGELVGLIGPNGAGKSTTIKTLLGVIQYMKGNVRWGDTTSYAYIPERPIFYDHLTLWEHLDLVASIHDIGDETLNERASKYLHAFRMEKVKDQFPSSFSKGMQQKAMIIQALLIKPHIYIVDEPFIGLDPGAIKMFLEVMEEEKRRGAGILMCTHVLDTAEKICDRFLLVSEGSIVAEGTLTEIQVKSGEENGSLLDCFHVLTEG
ncbi:ABC transporter ATP-binding protein [Bacillus weihaiensis]|uniref:ABC transporter ATP-binding protein n=1 Tax=Bacillus weihaiensis TaxID=1547283 RepID=A0A1L3MNW5_9BACI|nr:ABC transporter ATP-binding protein [Bacillus weihaiensis]APH04025.1 ABC transporter ATP-binding protein [Bacillus weihaiensis]